MIFCGITNESHLLFSDMSGSCSVSTSESRSCSMGTLVSGSRSTDLSCDSCSTGSAVTVAFSMGISESGSCSLGMTMSISVSSRSCACSSSTDAESNFCSANTGLSDLQDIIDKCSDLYYAPPPPPPTEYVGVYCFANVGLSVGR